MVQEMGMYVCMKMDTHNSFFVAGSENMHLFPVRRRHGHVGQTDDKKRGKNWWHNEGGILCP